MLKSKMTIDELLEIFPVGKEDDKWELKSGAYLELNANKKLKDKHKLQEELEVQASAFANSGGGFLVFGVTDKGMPDGCPTSVGRTPMDDVLSSMIEQAVEPALRDFTIHVVEVIGETPLTIYVVEFRDSVLAPHQARDARVYFYRTYGHSKRAPHFYLEVLRSRTTRALLAIENIDFDVTELKPLKTGQFRIRLLVAMIIRNVSLQSAQYWGVHVALDNQAWKLVDPEKGMTCQSLCVRGEREVLLPDEISKASVKLYVETGLDGSVIQNQFFESDIYGLWKGIGLRLRSVSHNCIGGEMSFPSVDANSRQEQTELFRMLLIGHLRRLSGDL